MPLEIENLPSLVNMFPFQVEAFQRDSSEEEEARVAAERRKRSIRRPPKIHAQVRDLLVRLSGEQVARLSGYQVKPGAQVGAELIR